jgi:chromosomal replication initiation ATPase DnaA
MCSPRYRQPANILRYLVRDRVASIIIQQIALFFDVPVELITSKNGRRLTGAKLKYKQITIYMLRKCSDLSWREISEITGGGNHDNAMYHFNTLCDRIDVYPEERAMIYTLMKHIEKYTFC